MMRREGIPDYFARRRSPERVMPPALLQCSSNVLQPAGQPASQIATQPASQPANQPASQHRATQSSHTHQEAARARRPPTARQAAREPASSQPRKSQDPPGQDKGGSRNVYLFLVISCLRILEQLITKNKYTLRLPWAWMGGPWDFSGWLAEAGTGVGAVAGCVLLAGFGWLAVASWLWQAVAGWLPANSQPASQPASHLPASQQPFASCSSVNGGCGLAANKDVRGAPRGAARAAGVVSMG